MMRTTLAFQPTNSNSHLGGSRYVRRSCTEGTVGRVVSQSGAHRDQRAESWAGTIVGAFSESDSTYGEGPSIDPLRLL